MSSCGKRITYTRSPQSLLQGSKERGVKKGSGRRVTELGCEKAIGTQNGKVDDKVSTTGTHSYQAKQLQFKGSLREGSKKQYKKLAK